MIACLETLYELVYAVLFIRIVIFDALRNPERLPGESEVSAVERGRGGAYRGGEHGGDVELMVKIAAEPFPKRHNLVLPRTDFRHSWRSMGGTVREDDVRASTGVDDLVNARSLEMDWSPHPHGYL
ncbi:hypothetical protein NEUTE1DRAFT_131906 [Neurospora tetrasperma FGSC 2508]|uniref:Uncharacterized protein n=1 Tax=Neurospora tetrasperma (strain FGSC 2508 / ATCC MYA-4615 / P0657) TaxID=510951 RepID=F8MX93_NEUT8|nr:uncharacterized protein NEUTE1DRAFT_131906 [Neurospora tetrasperma FGSC 2508]EGO54364.1 hypothetical protein NEUTE1DRAFT_131906 [Neurospora tetrasperma FGSC 2508]EGZ68195.1 hypothetical protein NEUTE2DRAFT_152731 [Neurospora tetrasperma FGSC 2509]